MSTTSTQSAQIYENATEGLQTLTKLWETMLNIIHSVSTASGSSLTVEPDLIALQKTRRELEQLLKSLQSTASWLDNVDMPEHSNQSDSEEYVELLKENKSAVEVRLLNYKMIFTNHFVGSRTCVGSTKKAFK
ncbi:hypothetical protein RMCBS344292_17989 [Rhizopus microsporus]|nr:hypothetical protein RMCBS344292_17989 [Rhizopus microsporus]